MSTIDESDDVSAQLRQLERLTREIDNFRDIARYILPTPGEVPRLQGIDVFGGTLPLSGSVGGDHLIYVTSSSASISTRASRSRASRAGPTWSRTSSGAAARPASRSWTCPATA